MYNRFLFLLSIIKKSKMESEQKESQLIVPLLNKPSCLVRINSEGVFDYKQHTIHHNKIFNSGQKLHLTITKSEVLSDTHQFYIKLSCEGTPDLDIVIKSQPMLEELFKITGHYSYVIGLQELVLSFNKIGEGAFAQVFEVITKSQQRFALKCFLKKSFTQDAKTRAGYHNQIQILKLLNSPYIIPFDYIFETDRGFYLKMQQLEMTLKQKIGKKLLVKQQKEMMRQLLLALIEMKNKNIIHRDLKPENIMMRVKENGEEECVIIDFGLATKADAKEYLYFRCGTPGFLAPEIANLTCKQIKQTCAADMFSLGCIFFKTLTGHYLFGGRTSKEVLQNNKRNNANKSHFSELSVKQASLLARMTDTNPKTRITPQQALKQPYFDLEIDDEDQIPEQQCSVKRYIQNMSPTFHAKKMDTLHSENSSFSLVEHSCSSQAYKVRGRESLKGSCLTFELGNVVSDQQFLKKATQTELRSSRKTSKTPEKAFKQSRFSKIGKDLI